MDRRLSRDPVRWLIALAAAAIVVAAGVFVYGRVTERYVETPSEGGGPGVSQIVSAKLTGMGRLEVAQLSGIVQATASDIRGFGWLRSDQVIKMPYSVGYYVDLSKVGAKDLTWDADARTLVVDAPEVTVAEPNTDEGRRTLVKTSGLFVTRAAGEALSRRTSLHAEAVAAREARSPERMAQAREHARRAIAELMAKPLAAAGFGNARIIVTFPPDRVDHRQWDVTRPIPEVLANSTS
ncbi:DUF4230 domain-containing protein [Hephaestia mangrovi]|uniref:DUF4230 domain-containing protein n=1 Tax=Hephaestia mangrovi TaxID=2873268 RepID=UPI001CA70F9A|nr:DUF4230 domain-containing protein [Hephaestia mangrovi]MBY8827277.1 DUF4230 domain-containing protein [Hephaestia mangrovi]